MLILTGWVHASHMGVPLRYSDASGNTLSAPSSYSVPGFPGQSQTPGLAGADLYYNRYRDYDSSTGRYIQADPIGLAGGPSPYSYAMNNPLRYTDPTGEHPVTLGGRLPNALAQKIIPTIELYDDARRSEPRPLPKIMISETQVDACAIGAAMMPLEQQFFSTML